MSSLSILSSSSPLTYLCRSSSLPMCRRFISSVVPSSQRPSVSYQPPAWFMPYPQMSEAASGAFMTPHQRKELLSKRDSKLPLPLYQVSRASRPTQDPMYCSDEEISGLHIPHTPPTGPFNSYLPPLNVPGIYRAPRPSKEEPAAGTEGRVHIPLPPKGSRARRYADPRWDGLAVYSLWGLFMLPIVGVRYWGPGC
eukprot:GHVS01024638.1.p1 GENE.GHVS01024638.1~~GHVS01024638.1.p1  ORF type:complete len:196 (+),score=19.94 GHVS01024638.1:46-633(+)